LGDVQREPERLQGWPERPAGCWEINDEHGGIGEVRRRMSDDPPRQYDVAHHERRKGPTLSGKGQNVVNGERSVFEHPQSAAFCDKNKPENVPPAQ